MKKILSPLSFIMMKEQEVLDYFGSKTGAIHVGDGDNQFVYIPGYRDDKILFVAHSDTVPGDHNISTKIDNDVIHSNTPYKGIGADDRAGCSILDHLCHTGHSILVCNKEEIGCVGSQFLMSLDGWPEEINSHRFAVQFDRRGSNDLVFYDVGNKDLLAYLKQTFIGYEKKQGSYTDICHLCTKMAGVNISVGYYNEHSPREILILKEWERTLEFAKKLAENKDIPRFEIEYAPSNNHLNYGYNSRQYYTGQDDDNDSVITKESTQVDLSDIGCFSCFHCNSIMDEAEYEQNNNTCVFCHAKL